MESEKVNDLGERTNWADPSICSKYNTFNRSIDMKFGVIPMIRDLKQTHGTNITVLDYGCGTGKVSRLLTEENIAKVEAVDTSENMINLAKQHSSPESINFRKINSGELPYKDESFDAVICCFVLINVHTRDALLKVTREIYRTLKPNGSFYILDLNPDYPAYHEYEGRPYRDGEKRPCELKISDHEVLKLTNTFWSRSTYEDILSLPGFVNIQVLKCGEAEGEVLRSNEASPTPNLLLKATKPSL